MRATPRPSSDTGNPWHWLLPPPRATVIPWKFGYARPVTSAPLASPRLQAGPTEHLGSSTGSSSGGRIAQTGGSRRHSHRSVIGDKGLIRIRMSLGTSSTRMLIARCETPGPPHTSKSRDVVVRSRYNTTIAGLLTARIHEEAL